MNRSLAFLLVVETAVLVWLAWLVAGDGTAEVVAARSDDAGTASTAMLLSGAARRLDDEQTEAALRRQVAPSPDSGEFLLFGCIVDPEGQPIPNASVYVSPEKSQPRARVSTQDDGGYSVFALTPGTWTLHADAVGYKKHSQTVIVTTESNEGRLDVTLEPATMVQVHAQTPEGVPLERAIRDAKLSWHTTPSVVAMRPKLPEAFPMRDTGGNLGIGVGQWRPASWKENRTEYPANWLGELELQVDPPIHIGLMLRQIVLQSQVLSRGQTKILFEVNLDDIRKKMGSVRVQVMSAVTGAPLTNARVGFHDAQTGGGGRRVDGEGVSVQEMPPGIWELDISAKDHESYYQLVRLEPGQKLDLGQFVLDKAQILKGVVVGLDGKPAQAHIRWDALDRHTFPQELRNNMITSCNAEGEFSIWRIGRGRYAVHAYLGRFGTEGVAHTLVDTRGGAPQDLRIQLQEAVQVRIVNEVPETETYLLLIQTPEGLPVRGTNVRHGADFSVWLPVGEYVAELYRDAKLVRNIPLRITKDGATLQLR